MKKRDTLFNVAYLVLIYCSYSQITQLELATGIDKTDFTSISFRPLDQNSTFTINTLAFFQKFHRSEEIRYDETGVQTTLYWNADNAISIGPSLYYNSVTGFTERLSVLYAIRSTHFILNAIPTISHAEETGFINGELFLQLQLTHPVKQDFNLLFSVQMFSHWEQFNIHTRSFQQIRMGLDKRATQYGLAIDYDQFGEAPTTIAMMGVFIRKIFQNN